MFRLEFLLTLCTISAAYVAEAAGADLYEIVRHAPANAVLAIASDDIGQTCADFQRTRLGETLVGDSFKPLIAELKKFQLGGPLHLPPMVGFDWSDLAEAHTASCLVLVPLADGKQGLAWIFAGAAPDADTGPLAAAARYFTSQQFRSTSETRGAARLTTWTPPASKKQESPRVVFTSGNFHGVANSPAAAEALLAVTAEKSLASTPLWQQAAKLAAGVPKPGDVTVLLRPFELWDLSRSANPQPEKPAAAAGDQAADTAEAEEPPRDPLASSRQLGFDGIQAVVARITFSASAPSDWQIAALLVAPRPFAKAMRLLDLQTAPLPSLPAFAAADMTSATYWQWDFPTAMKGFGNLYDESNEPGPDGVGLFEDMLDGLRDDPEGVQVDLREEVFKNLGPAIYSISDQHGAKSKEQPNGERTLYVATVRDQAKVADALERFYRDDERVKRETAGAYQIWTVPEGASLFVEGESDSVVSVRALALGENRMLFGTDAAQLQAALTGNPTGPALAQDAGWTSLWQQMQSPADAAGALWSLTRLDDALAPAYAKAAAAKPGKDDGAMASLWRVLLFGTADPEVQVPHAAAPKFELVRPGLPRISARLSPSAEGWNVTINALRRED